LFDAARYDREVLRPLRGAHGQLPPGDLLARYAVDLTMDAAALTAHLAEIRAWWGFRATAPDFRAQVCGLLLAADRDLQASVGPAMTDPAWWREQASEVTAPAGAPEAVEEPAPQAPAGPRPEHDWRVGARAQFWTALAALDVAPAAGSGAPVRVATAGARPAAVAEPLAWRLRVEPTTADGDRCQVELSWPGELPPGVRVRHAAELPPFPPGAEIAWSAAQRWGADLPGTVVRRGDRTSLAATVPTGYRVYLPFEVDGDRARAGRPVTLGVADPVQRLQADRDGTGAVVTWVWPGGAQTAQVEWITDTGTERQLVTRGEYAADRGFPLADARAGGRVEVRALTAVGDGMAFSPAAVTTVAPAPVEVRYTLQRRRRLGGDHLVLALTADRDCTGLEAVVVAAPGEFLPLDATCGVETARLGPLRLTGGVPDRHVLRWPRVPKPDRPFWIRCFVRHPTQPVSVADPPTDHMRIS
jgi:hypothetical protein